MYMSIGVLAYNEEGNIVATLKGILKEAIRRQWDFEILVIDDCSQDKTAQRVRELSKAEPRIKLFTNETNKGVGYGIKRSIELASGTWYMIFPGDNSASFEDLANFLDLHPGADAVAGYISNLREREPVRVYWSQVYRDWTQWIFRHNLRYTNGLYVLKTDLAKSLDLQAKTFTTGLELAVKLKKARSVVAEEGYRYFIRSHGKSTAFSLKTFFKVFFSLWYLYWYLHSWEAVPSAPLGMKNTLIQENR